MLSAPFPLLPHDPWSQVPAPLKQGHQVAHPALPCLRCSATLLPQVSAVWAYQARYRVPLNKAVAGNWVLLEGVDATSEPQRLPPGPAATAADADPCQLSDLLLLHWHCTPGRQQPGHELLSNSTPRLASPQSSPTALLPACLRAAQSPRLPPSCPSSLTRRCTS